jgi:hypothetical protein
MIEKEIARAKELHEEYGEAMIHDGGLFDLVEKYRKAILNTQELMLDVGITEACKVCARKGDGSCCYQGVEVWYDHLLLFVNLLLGVDISGLREVQGGCFFVGSNGCTLLARHSFCVNYLCPSLKDRLKGSQTEQLNSGAGAELYLGWELERSIQNWIHVRDKYFTTASKAWPSGP